ncbi:hypothetical protein FKM82_029269 [Ascaphus truei]
MFWPAPLSLVQGAQLQSSRLPNREGFKDIHTGSAQVSQSAPASAQASQSVPASAQAAQSAAASAQMAQYWLRPVLKLGYP